MQIFINIYFKVKLKYILNINKFNLDDSVKNQNNII